MEDWEEESPGAAERQLIENEWRRINEAIENVSCHCFVITSPVWSLHSLLISWQEGFREGFDYGADKARQEGFDTGYKQSFDVFEDYGQLNGLFV